MISFKQFLTEGGNATSKHDTRRASAADVASALSIVGKVLHIPVETLRDNLIGSANLTLLGVRHSSGDVDIALELSKYDPSTTHTKMLKAIGDGSYNPGSRIGSYPVSVSDGGKIQVDLMFVTDAQWAKWIYHSSEGHGSKYPGAVRNILLFTALAHHQEPGKDFVMRDEEGKVVIRASRSVRMDIGMERLFKMAKYNAKNSGYGRMLRKVDPKEIEAHLHDIGKKIDFSHEPEITNDPDKVASFVFGVGVKAKDLMTAESVIKQIKKMKNRTQVLAACRSELTRLHLPIPEEI